MDILKKPNGYPPMIRLTDLEQQVIEDLQGFPQTVTLDDAISQLQSLYPELVAFHHPHPDDTFWDYARTQRDA